MKRTIALLLAIMAILTTLTLTACGEKKDGNSDKDAASNADTNKEENKDNEKDPPKEAKYTDALAVLDAIWNTYADDDKFPALGGNRDAMVESKPGSFDLKAAEELTSSYLLPAENIASLKSMASLVNMMNGNTFSAAVFQTDGDLDALSKILVDAANKKQFICGAPETIVTLKVENYLIMAFGADGNVTTFKTNALAVEGVSLIHEGPITFSGGDNGNGGAGGFGGVVIPMG